MKTARRVLVPYYLTPMNCGIRPSPFKMNGGIIQRGAVEDKSGTWQLRYYQKIAVNNALEAIAQQQANAFC